MNNPESARLAFPPGRHRARKYRLAVSAGAALLAVLVTAGMTVFGGVAYAATLFADDFNDGNADGWSRSGGSWSIATDGSQVYRQSSAGADAKAQAGQSTWTNYTVQARIKPLSYNGADRSVAVLGRAQNMTNYYYLALRSTGVLDLGKRAGGGFVSLATAQTSTQTGAWRTVTLQLSGSTLTGLVDGQPLVSANDSTFSSGKVGLSTYYATASFDDVTVTDTLPPTSPSASASGPASPSASASPSGPASPSPSVSTSPPPPGTCNTSGAPIGFAAVNAWGRNGTTGGAGGPIIEVDTTAEFLSAIGQAGPLIICVKGTITLPATPQMHQVTSNKSIIGVGATALITGGGLNIGLPLDNAITSPPANAVNNVIIRNLSFRNATDDSINVQMFSHHIWLDHLDMAQGYDGLLDIKRGSSYITVSWVHTHHHSKNMLLGRDDADSAQDVGRLKVSYHHNWFDATPQRNPRVRYGEPVHIYNNYFFYNTDIGVACQTYAGCMVEGNYFENVEEPVSNNYAGPAGRCVARNNIYTGTEPGQPDCSGSVEEPSNYYAYTLDNPSSVKALVTAGAGVGKI